MKRFSAKGKQTLSHSLENLLITKAICQLHKYNKAWLNTNLAKPLTLFTVEFQELFEIFCETYRFNSRDRNFLPSLAFILFAYKNVVSYTKEVFSRALIVFHITLVWVILNDDYSWPNWFFNREEIQRITSPNDQHFWQNNPANACDGNVAIHWWFHQSQRGFKWYRWNWLDLRNRKRNFGRGTCRKENRIYPQDAEIARSCHKWEINEDRPLVSCVRSCSCLVTSVVVVNLCGEKPDHVLADRPADSPAFLRTCSIP